jgi:Zn-dependent protease with chaperone function
MRRSYGRDFGLSLRRRFELVMDHPPMRKRIARLEELSRELGKARG